MTSTRPPTEENELFEVDDFLAWTVGSKIRVRHLAAPDPLDDYPLPLVKFRMQLPRPPWRICLQDRLERKTTPLAPRLVPSHGIATVFR
jgi:hypothetical protein